MGDDITIGVTEIVNNIEVTAQPNDQIVDISVTDNADNVTLNITPTVVEVNINKGSSFAQWGDLYGTLSDQTDLQNALNLKANLVDGKVPASELPSYVDDIIEVANYAALPATGEIGKIYVTLDNNKIYRWSGSIYIEIASNSAIWGAITGTLSSQTDLQNALNAKQNTITLTTTGTTGAATLVGSTLNIPNYTTDISGLVPYTGATTNVDLGAYKLTASDLVINHASGSGVAASITKGGNGEALTVVKSSGSGNAASITGGTTLISELHLTTDLADDYIASAATWNAKQAALNGTGFVKISGTTISYDNNTYALDNTVVKLTGDQSITGSKSFTTNTAAPAMVVTNNSTDNGILLQNTSTGNALRINNGALSTGDLIKAGKDGNVTFIVNQNGNTTAASFIKSGGTSSQFLKADGSVDSTTYQTALTNPVTGTGTTNYIPKFTGASAIGNSAIYDNSGKIGIGTTTTPYKFNVYDTSDGVVGHFGGGVSNYTLISFKSNEANVYSTSLGSYNSGMLFRTGATDRMYINSGGNVGIGTTSPNQLLSISSSAVGGSTFGLYNTASNTDNRNWALKLNANNYGDLGFFVSSSNGGNPESGSIPMLINKSGNVGIGTTSPTLFSGYRTLALNDVSGAALELKVNDVSGLKIFSDSGSSYFYENRAVDIKFFNNASERMRLTTNGELLIGRTSSYGAGWQLAVEGNIYAKNDLRIDGGGSFGGNIRVGNSLDNSSQWVGKSVTGTENFRGAIKFTSTTTDDIIQFNTHRSGVSSDIRMTIDGIGNVGIGTTSPAAKLEVASDGSNWISGTFSGTGNTDKVVIGNLTGATIGGHNAALNAWTDFTIAGDSIIFAPFGSEKMRVNGSGNVGIGTTSPTFKLDILSSGANTRINSADANGSYLVFANNGTAKAYIGSAYHLFGSPYNIVNDLGLRSDAAMSFSTGGTPVRMHITSDGLVLMPSVYINAGGGAANVGIFASGELFRSTSSLKYKKNVENYTKGLNEIMQMRPVTYNSINENEDGVQYAGLIAEEIHDLGLTEFVQYDEDGTPDALSYANMVSLLVKGIQELKQEIEILKNK